MKLTKVAMAKMIGIAPGILADWEKSKCKPDKIRTKKITDFIWSSPLNDRLSQSSEN